MDDRVRWAQMLAAAPAGRSVQPQRICQLCVDTLDISGAGISMVTAQGNRGVVCATDDISAQIEALQFTLGEGPCVDAVRAGSPVLVQNLAEPEDIALDRWPGFMDGAEEAGVHAVFAFPLRIGAISVGALDLYRDRPGGLGSDQLAAALMAADAAAVALVHLDLGRESMFQDDLAARSTYQLQVHQATGMVQVQLATTAEQALLMLRARAFSTDRPLVDVASDVLARRLRFSPEDR